MACLPPRRCVPSSPLTPHCHLISKKCSGPCVDPPLPPSLLTTYHLPLLPSILAAAFPFAICVLHFYTVFISCDALGGYASPSLSWPFFSLLPLSLSFSAFPCLITAFSLYMVSLIYALHSPSNCTWLSHFCPCRPACHTVDAHPLLALVAVNHCLSIFSFARADGVSSPLVMPYLCF